MKCEVTILVGTMGGNAEMLAEEVADKLKCFGFLGRVVRMEDFAADDMRGGVYLICTSTYGVGELPTNAVAFFEALKTACPDLREVSYGVIGLGDSIYPKTFCFGGKRFDELLASLGAQRIGERLDHDSRSSVYPEDAAAEWLEKWIPLVPAFEASV